MKNSRIMLLVKSTVVVLVVVVSASIAWKAHVIHRYFGLVNDVRTTIDSFHNRRPLDVPEEQWDYAVDWTSNIICQVFFTPDEKELKSLRQLSTQLDQMALGSVDLGTLRWVWDECEAANGGADSYAIRFRNVKLLTKGPITDSRLPHLWSLERCTNLDLSDTEITDSSVWYLKRLTQLEILDICRTGISAEGARELIEGLPNCRVSH